VITIGMAGLMKGSWDPEGRTYLSDCSTSCGPRAPKSESSAASSRSGSAQICKTQNEMKAAFSGAE